MNNRIKSFINDSIKTLVSPKEYFTAMNKESSFLSSYLKVLSYVGISVVIDFLFKIMTLSFSLTQLSSAVIFLLVAPFLSLIIGILFTMIISAIGSGSTKIQHLCAFVASLCAISPIFTLIDLLEIFKLPILVYILNFLLIIYCLWIFYNGLVYSLSCKPKVAAVISVILGIIYVIVFGVLIVYIIFFQKKILNTANIINSSINQSTDDVTKDKIMNDPNMKKLMEVIYKDYPEKIKKYFVNANQEDMQENLNKYAEYMDKMADYKNTLDRKYDTRELNDVKKIEELIKNREADLSNFEDELVKRLFEK